MFEELFMKKRIIPSKLRAYGFTCTDGVYRYATPMDGGYILHITLDRYGNPDTSLVEIDTAEEYNLYKTTAEGFYVGWIRTLIGERLQEIADRCCEASVFRQAQTERLLAHAAATFGSEPEFLWKETPDCCILRRADSEKWYAVIMTIPQSKLGFDSDAPVEILNLHATPEAVAALLARPEVFPAWHMNKKSWFTVILDGGIMDEALFSWLAESYRLAQKSTRKPSSAQ